MIGGGRWRGYSPPPKTHTKTCACGAIFIGTAWRKRCPDCAKKAHNGTRNSTDPHAYQPDLTAAEIEVRFQQALAEIRREGRYTVETGQWNYRDRYREPK